MEPTLPVWSIRPNWRGGILERLDWLTDVLTSSIGVEQRRSLRLSPRRSIEITINPTQSERTFVDLLLHRLGGSDWLFPLWFDKAKLTVAAEEEDERIEFDNTFREHRDGGLALLYKDAFTWEVISIAAQDDNGLDLALPLDSDWGKGTVVYPLRQARLGNETALDALSSRVGQSVLLWTIFGDNDFEETMPDELMFEGMPVLTRAPNRSETISLGHTRLQMERDNRVGIPYRVDEAERAFQVQSHRWMIVGRQAQAEFRSMLYWLRGRQRAVWLPSFNEDIVTSRASANGSQNLDVRKIGIAYAGGVIPGRDVVRVAGVPARITALGAPQSPQEERLRIGAGLTAAIPAGRSGSFMSPARFNQDTIEIKHHADSNGAIECSATFKTFDNSRDASGAIYLPIPITEKNGLACGQVGFSGLSWQLPCFSVGATCSCPAEVVETYVVNGEAGLVYGVELRVRAVCETKSYSGGALLGGGLCMKDPTGGTGGVINTYRLTVSDPPAVYYLNNAPFTATVLLLDYTMTIPIAAGATLTLYAGSGDSGQHANLVPLFVPDDDPSNPVVVAQPYDGQFMQIDGAVP